MANAYFVMLWVYVCTWLVTQVLFLARAHNEPVKSRQPMMVLWQNGYALLHLLTITITLYIVQEGGQSSCVASHFTSVFFLPLWGFPFFLRAFHLWYNFRMSEETYLQNEAFLAGRAKSSVPTKLPWVLTKRSAVSSHAFNATLLLVVIFIFTAVALPVYFTDANLAAAVAADPRLEICLGNQAIVIAIQGALCAAGVLIAAGCLYRVTDAFLVKVELTVMGASYLVLYVIWMIAAFTTAFPNPLSVYTMDLVLIFLSLLVTQIFPTFISFTFMKFSTSFDEEYRKQFSRRNSHFTGSKRDSTTDLTGLEAEDMSEVGDSAFFKFVLENEVLSRSFEKFAVDCRNTEGLYFYRHVQAYRKIKDDNKRLQEAKRIGKEYLDPNAPFAIKIPSDMKEEILHRIEAGNCNPSLFHRAEVLVFIQMRHNAYPIWRKSKSFRIVLEEAGVRRPSLPMDEKVKPDLDGGKTLSQSIRDALRKRMSDFQMSTVSLFGTRSSKGSAQTDLYSSVNTYKGGSISSTYSMSEEPQLKKDPPRRPSVVWEKSEEELANTTIEKPLDGIKEEQGPSTGNSPTVPAEQVQEEILSKVEKRKSKPKFHPQEEEELSIPLSS